MPLGHVGDIKDGRRATKREIYGCVEWGTKIIFFVESEKLVQDFDAKFDVSPGSR